MESTWTPGNGLPNNVGDWVGELWTDGQHLLVELLRLLGGAVSSAELLGIWMVQLVHGQRLKPTKWNPHGYPHVDEPMRFVRLYWIAQQQRRNCFHGFEQFLCCRVIYHICLEQWKGCCSCMRFCRYPICRV